MKKVYLTGITTTGTPHLGNYAGAIKPAIEASKREDTENYYFLADLHALIKSHEPAAVAQSRIEIAAAWLALGLDADKAVFYRQSDIPEIPALTWLLTCVTAKGLMNRAHAYKAVVQANEQADDQDPDRGINMGLYSYPVLMAADILMFKAHVIPVGRDQIQHIEMARDIAQRFNHHYGEHFVLPEAQVDDTAAVLAGLDGRKMSKSYNNTIPLFVPEKQLRKLIMRIKTNSQEPGEPKEPDGNTLFEIYRAFATADQTAEYRRQFEEGIAWGTAKQTLFELLNSVLAEPRERYLALLEEPAKIEEVLQQGAARAREQSSVFLAQLYKAVGLSSFS
jgi:tryptophanyl-tRNA synthetase